MSGPQTTPGIAFEQDGWWGGIVVRFDPDVDGREANAILREACLKIERQNRRRVVKATFQGPASDGKRDG